MEDLKQKENILRMIRDKVTYQKISYYMGVSQKYIKEIHDQYKATTRAVDVRLLRKVVQDMCLMDDKCMSLCLAGNIAGVECIINTILSDKKLKVVESRVQSYIPNLSGHDVTLDVLATDQYGNKIDIEIQNSSEDAIPQRARYYSSMVDYSMLESGEKYRELRESYVIFITKHDVLKEGKPLYHIDRVVGETNKKFADGSHIIYVNGEIQDDTPLGLLIQDLFCKDPENMHYAELKERMQYLKKTREGVSEMTGPLAEIIEEREAAVREQERKAATEMVEQEKRKLAENIISEMNVTPEKVASITGLSLDEVKRIAGTVPKRCQEMRL